MKDLILTLLDPEHLLLPLFLFLSLPSDRGRVVPLVSIHGPLAPPEVVRGHMRPPLEWGFDNQSFFFRDQRVGSFKDWVAFRCVCVCGGGGENLGALFLR
jgi:hypothetical protein